MIRFVRLCRAVLLLLVWLSFCKAAAADGMLHHELSITLELGTHRLRGVDTIRVTDDPGSPLRFHLAPQVQIVSVAVDGRSARYSFNRGTLQIESRGRIIAVEYAGRFDDAAPARPLNTDNPGYGVSATIGAQGVLLLPGSGWYPQSSLQGDMQLSVTAPAGILAVTSGKPLGHQTVSGHTVSRWHAAHLVEGLSLAAGPYQRRTLQAGRITVATYFTPALEALAPSYLHASAGYLAMYQDLFGPYAFDQFAIVENFFPTGYGFPGFTLMGRQVLQLPFIVHTSLGHEIAHCWWGNGVLVDDREGNWSEGLTTYVADYLYQEQRSAEAARQRRVQWLRDYATLVSPADDFALSAFTSRTDPVTKTIGYDKGAMVFHMLRREIGEKAFWQALRDIYARRRFEKTSWRDLQAAFEKRAGRPLGTFFAQWVRRTGAPQLALAQVGTAKTASGYVVSGRLEQTAPYYALTVPVTLQTASQTLTRQVSLSGADSRFSFESREPPRLLKVDPQTDLFRHLAPEEVPVTINTLKGARRVTIVLNRSDPAWKTLAQQLAISLGLKKFTIISESRNPLPDAGALLWIGWPEKRNYQPPAFEALQVTARDFTLNHRQYHRSRASFFALIPHNKRPLAVFVPAGGGDLAQSVALKITHYGKYSYLAFEGARNEDKGTWPVTATALTRSWPAEEK